jgi:hypothetical protein
MGGAVVSTLSNVGNAIYDNVIKPVADFAVGSWNWFVKQLEILANGITSGFNDIFNFTKLVGNKITDLLDSAKKGIEKIIKDLESTLTSWIKNIENGIKTTINSLLDFVKILESAIMKIYRTFIDAFEQFGKMIASFFTKFGNYMNDYIFTPIVSKINNIFRDIEKVAKNVIKEFEKLFDMVKDAGSGIVNILKNIINDYLLHYLNFIGGIGKAIFSEADPNDTSFWNCLPSNIYSVNNKFRNITNFGFLPIIAELYIKKMHVEKKPQCGVTTYDDTSFMNCYPVYMNTLNKKMNVFTDPDVKNNLQNETNQKPQCVETTMNYVFSNIMRTIINIILLYFFLIIILNAIFEIPTIPPLVILSVSMFLYIYHITIKENRKQIDEINDNISSFLNIIDLSNINLSKFLLIVFISMSVLYIFKKLFTTIWSKFNNII